MSKKQDKGKLLRNKMVAFMYLIFIVLAFIYIPTDFIDTIRFVNTSMENSTEEMHSATGNNLRIIKTGQSVDSAKITSILSHLDTVSLTTDEIFTKIETIKQSIIDISGGTNELGYLKNAKENQFADRVLFDENVSKELREALLAYKKFILNHEVIYSSDGLDSILPTNENIITSTGKGKEWEKFYFYKMPLTVSVSLLSKFQNDIRKIESSVVGKYLSDIYENYDLELVEKKEKEEEKEIVPKEENDEKKPEKKKEEKPEIKPEHLKEALIENTDLVVLYVGVYNSLKIYHPLSPTLNINAKISSGNIIKKDSLFYAKVNRPGLVEVTAYAEGDKLIATRTFLAKRLPNPSILLGNRKGGTIFSKLFKVQKNLNVTTEIASAEGGYTIKKFALIRIGSDGKMQRSETNLGAFFNTAALELINQASKGDLFIFEDIEVEGPDGGLTSMEAMIFKIT